MSQNWEWFQLAQLEEVQKMKQLTMAQGRGRRRAVHEISMGGRSVWAYFSKY
jgi:hypothetical protein